MNTHKWASGRFDRLVDLHQFSKEELIEELVSERREYLELEKMLDEEYGKREKICDPTILMGENFS